MCDAGTLEATPWTILLRGHRNLVMEKLRCKISPIRPGQRVSFRVNLKVGKVLRVLEGFKYRAIEFIRKINLTLGSIVEMDPHNEVLDMTGINNSNHG